MTPDARAHKARQLSRQQVRLTYHVRKLSRVVRGSPMTHALEKQLSSVREYFAREAELAVREVRSLAELDAWADSGQHGGRETVAHRLEAGSAALGRLRAERAKLDARLEAECLALRTCEKQLLVRLKQRVVGMAFPVGGAAPRLGRG